MGFIRKMASAILGSSETDLVRAKKQVQYGLDKAKDKELANTIEKMVMESYEQVVEKIIYTLGNAAKHHAKLSSAEHISNSPFVERFVEVYALEIFTKGISMGYELSRGEAHPKLQEEIGILLSDVNNKMMNEARRYFSQKEVECFTIAAHTAFELGAEAGHSLYDQEYIATRR